MKQGLTDLLAELEQRWQREQKEQASIPREQAMAKVDDYLLPVGPQTGRLMNDLIKAARSRVIVEVGSSYGYSTLWLADAAGETGGHVYSLEMHAGKIAYAKSLLKQVGLHDQVTFIEGDARVSIKGLRDPVDFVLIDLWKDLYIPCFDGLRPLLANGAIVVADNMVFPPDNHANAVAYRNRVLADPQIDSVLLPIGSGIELSRVRPADFPRG
jgi:predicted O-methyltransferase YrrM